MTVKNCSTYGVTCGGSILTVTDITTENNAWGGINVDNTSSSASGGTFTMNSGTINESNAIFIENTKSAESGPEATIVDGKFNGNVSIAKDTGNTQEDISGVKLIVKGGTFSNSVLDYADETIKFEVSNAGKYTYYTTGEAAVKAAGDTGVITGISDEESPLAITAPARSGAKLTVNPATTTVVAPSGYYLTSVKMRMAL